MNDNLKCSNCNFKLILPVGTEVCPVCGSKGTLAWRDPSKPETNEPCTPPEMIKQMRAVHKRTMTKYNRMKRRK